MSSVLGTVGLLFGFLIAGEALLTAIGVVRGPRQGLVFAGLAIFSGWVVTALLLSLGLLVGVEPTPRSAAIVWAMLIVAAVITHRKRVGGERGRTALREAGAAGKALAIVGAMALVGSLLTLLARSWQPTGVLHADVWNQWLPKAKILYFFGGLDTRPGGFTSQFNPDYPPLNAVSEALALHAIGSADVLDLARFHWALAASFILGVAAILAPRVRPAILWPSLALLSVSPAFRSLVGSSLADEPLAFMIAMAGITTIVWLLEGDRSYIVLAGLFLAAATATKNEGLMLALIVVISLAATRKGRSHPRLLVALGATILTVHGVWRIWLARHDVPRNPFYDLSDALDPGYLASRIDRLSYAIGELLGQLVTPSRWLLLVPAALIMALLASRRSPALSLFVASVVVLDVLGFSFIYWLSSVDLHFYVDNTVGRLPAFIAVFSGAVLPLLIGDAAPGHLSRGADGSTASAVEPQGL